MMESMKKYWFAIIISIAVFIAQLLLITPVWLALPTILVMVTWMLVTREGSKTDISEETVGTGDGGTSITVQDEVEKLKAMLDAAVLFIQEEAKAVRTQTIQANDIVSDAVNTLADSFNKLNEDTRAEHDMVMTLVESMGEYDEDVGALNVQQLSD